MQYNDITSQDIDRLNYLYNKSNTIQGLSYEEEEEQGLLRQKLFGYFNDKVKY